MLRAMRRDLGRLIGETTRLSGFDFAPARSEVDTFRDVQAAADSLEQAKTALRALGKYVPLDLVRRLYEARVEPMLGAEIQDVTLLFSDIEGFTTLSEQLTPNALAVALGAYLETMTRAIHSTGGIIDKYTGDGVMALWNTPNPCEHHAERACEAALACRDATAALFGSPVWAGVAPWRTRFGIHRAEVNVGHFGAPDRMSFTAMGDGVNLASRLESLNKQYGTFILVSASVERDARERFHFRRVDRVAVKGKREGVEIFELRRPPRGRCFPHLRSSPATSKPSMRTSRAVSTTRSRSSTDAPTMLRAECSPNAADASAPKVRRPTGTGSTSPRRSEAHNRRSGSLKPKPPVGIQRA